MSLVDIAIKVLKAEEDAKEAAREAKAEEARKVRQKLIQEAEKALKDWLTDSYKMAKIDIKEVPRALNFEAVLSEDSYTMDSEGEYRTIPATVQFRVDGISFLVMHGTTWRRHREQLDGDPPWIVYVGTSLADAVPVAGLAHLGMLLQKDKINTHLENLNEFLPSDDEEEEGGI